MSIKFDNYWKQVEREQSIKRQKKKVVKKNQAATKFTRKQRIAYFRAKSEMDNMDRMFSESIK